MRIFNNKISTYLHILIHSVFAIELIAARDVYVRR